LKRTLNVLIKSILPHFITTNQIIFAPNFFFTIFFPSTKFLSYYLSQKNLHRKIFPPEKISFVNSILEKFLLTFAFPIFKLKSETLPNYKAGHNKIKLKGKITIKEDTFKCSIII
jgi:hypothetical protein